MFENRSQPTVRQFAQSRMAIRERKDRLVQATKLAKDRTAAAIRESRELLDKLNCPKRRERSS
jgi:hypothetical protein